MTNQERIRSALVGVSQTTGIDHITCDFVGPLHCIVQVYMKPWTKLAFGYLHWKAYNAVRAVVDDDLSLVEVWRWGGM